MMSSNAIPLVQPSLPFMGIHTCYHSCFSIVRNWLQVWIFRDLSALFIHIYIAGMAIFLHSTFGYCGNDVYVPPPEHCHISVDLDEQLRKKESLTDIGKRKFG